MTTPLSPELATYLSYESDIEVFYLLNNDDFTKLGEPWIHDRSPECIVALKYVGFEDLGKDLYVKAFFRLFRYGPGQARDIDSLRNMIWVPLDHAGDAWQERILHLIKSSTVSPDYRKHRVERAFVIKTDKFERFTQIAEDILKEKRK